MATDATTRLAGPTALGTAATTVYTVPAATTATMLGLHVCNEGNVQATFTVSIGADAAGRRLWYSQPVPAYTSFDWTGIIVLNAADVLQAYASLASALTLTISGVTTA